MTARHFLSKLPGGFTTIELLISMALLGILAGVGIPQLMGIYNKQQVINAANEMVSAIKQAQNQALSNNQRQWSTNPPQATCTAATNYVDSYVIVTSGDSYDMRLTLKPGCQATGSALTQAIRTYNLPPNLAFNGGIGRIAYKTTSGQAFLGVADINNPPVTPTTQGSFVIQNTNASLSYYVCVDTTGRAYAQKNACP